MNKETLHMKIGNNLGEILLDIAQNNINNGNVEKAITTYTDSLQGFTKEYVLMCLKNEAVLTVDEENQVMDLTDDPGLLKENANLIYDWNLILENKKKLLNDIRDKRLHIKKEFDNISNINIEDYSIIEMMQRYYTDEALQKIGIHNIAARIIGAKDNKICNSGSDNPQSKWDKLCDQMEYEENPDVPKCNKVLYWTVEYVKTIKLLHKEFMEFDKIYHFLIDNKLAKRIPFIEANAEAICDILNNFADNSTGYYHPLCNTGLYDYKANLNLDILHTTFGKEYFNNGILKKNIMDGYDAGWLSPEGEFYGDNGPASAMIHMNIADKIFEASTNKYAIQMTKDNVNIYGGNNAPDYWLEKHGWIKIHNDEIYGSFIGEKDSAKRTKDFPYYYCPTEIQIKMICDYADKYYGGKFLTEAKCIGLKNDSKVTTYKVRQMDEIKLHETFGR